MGNSSKKRGLFSKIESRDDALKAIKESSNAFFVVAALIAALALFLKQPWNLVDVVIMATCALFLRTHRSRVAAIVLLVLTALEGAQTVANRLGAVGAGGNNVVLAVIVLLAAVRAVQATFKLRKIESAALQTNPLVRA